MYIQESWQLACIFVQEHRINEAILCLEVVCANDYMQTPSINNQKTIILGHILLAEICLTECNRRVSRENDSENTLWQNRRNRAEKCINIIENVLQLNAFQLHCDWEARYLKAKYLLVKLSNLEKSSKYRQILEILCDGINCRQIKSNREVDVDMVSDAQCSDRQIDQWCNYFLEQLQLFYRKIYHKAVMRRYKPSPSTRCILQDSDTSLSLFRGYVGIAQDRLLETTDDKVKAWLAGLTLQSFMISSLTTPRLMKCKTALDISNALFERNNRNDPLNYPLRINHLILAAFHCLRIGKIKDVLPIIEELKELQSADTTIDKKYTQGRLFRPDYISSIIDNLHLSVLAGSDSTQALDFSVQAIQDVQKCLNRTDEDNDPDIHLMLVGCLQDMLYIHCRLQIRQSKYSELASSLHQMVTLFEVYSDTLQQSVYYEFFLARLHVLIAMYANCIGHSLEACFHLRYIIEKLLPKPSDVTSYPDQYLSIWVDILEVGVYCSGASDPDCIGQVSTSGVTSRMKRIYPRHSMLEFIAQVFQSDELRCLLRNAISKEVQVKFIIAKCKWLWATENLKELIKYPLIPKLEEIRPTMKQLLQHAIEQASTYVCCDDTTAEIMALLGPLLINLGEVDSGEEILKNAIRISISGKNIILQTRLFVDIYELYHSKHMIEIQSTTESRYKKKFSNLCKRIAQAQAEESINENLFQWTIDSKK